MRAGWLFTSMVALSGCAPAPDAGVQALKDTEAAWMKDAATRDPEKFLAHYSEDASLLLPGQPAMAGKAAIRASLEPMLRDPRFALSLHPAKVEVAKSGDLGFTQGTYEATGTDPSTGQSATEKGNYVTVFRRQADGRWKAVADMISPNAPPPAKPQ
jgi:uncharacterized protein (TIGR02246 family)